jgi:outer membrane protein OmpA-like peptidoglycan-associated protein
MANRASSLSLQPYDPPEPKKRGSSRTVVLFILLLLVLLGAFGLGGYEMFKRNQALEAQVAALAAEARQANAQAKLAADRAASAESSARAAAEGRQVAEEKTAASLQEADTARQERDVAQQDATSARDAAAKAQAETDRIRKQAEQEMNRLEQALGQIAETRRTALGVVMNLDTNHLKFEFDKAELRPSDRELLSRIAGILLTSQDYTVSVNGHTDDVGTDAYNQKLSERRAQAVRDYLVKAGLPADIMSVTGKGKSQPLVKGTSDEARAKNRRVELGIASSRIRYGRQATR